MASTNNDSWPGLVRFLNDTTKSAAFIADLMETATRQYSLSTDDAQDVIQLAFHRLLRNDRIWPLTCIEALSLIERRIWAEAGTFKAKAKSRGVHEGPMPLPLARDDGSQYDFLSNAPDPDDMSNPAVEVEQSDLRQISTKILLQDCDRQGDSDGSTFIWLYLVEGYSMPEIESVTGWTKNWTWKVRRRSRTKIIRIWSILGFVK